MRQFTALVFVLVFAVAGKGQVQHFSLKQISLNSISAANENSSGQYALFFQNGFFDEQDINDLDGCDCVFISPDSNFNSLQYEIKNVATILPRLLLIHVCELLLDLPPPLLSV
ncbi:MAG TPA: hypothetical protein VLQ91_03330 [Draconibacterium sp.]|nr:hypothetical protein [Draconibacterium sp.]